MRLCCAAKASQAATAKPSTVASPMDSSALACASGTIESTSMTSSAPAANPMIPAWTSSLTASASAKPPTVARAQTAAIPPQSSSTRDRRTPALSRSAAEPIDSGQVRHQDRDDEHDADSFAGAQAGAEHELLREAVQQRAQRERRSGPVSPARYAIKMVS